MKTKIFPTIIAFIAMSISISSYSEDSSELCPNSNALEKMINNLCWDCIFPIYVGGVEIQGSKGKSSGNNTSSGTSCYYCSDSNSNNISTNSSKTSSNSSNIFSRSWHNTGVPDGALKNSLCTCQEGALKKPGISESMWEPARLIEFPYRAGCFPTLGGLYMKDAFEFLNLGNEGRPNTVFAKQSFNGQTEFRFSHLYAFPVLQMAGMMTNAVCTKDAYVDLDLLNMTEFDPTWKDAGISAITNPEVLLVTAMNIAAEVGCLPETVKTTVNETPVDSLFWCAGNWENFYPLVGETFVGGAGQASSYELVRTLALLHRSGREFGTKGKVFSCGARVTEYLPKSQYKVQYFFPKAENGSHVIGFPFIAWDYANHYPTPKGETPGYVIFRWNDCCNTNIVAEGIE